MYKTTFVCLFFFKLKQKKNIKTNFVYGFCFKTQKRSFWGVNQFFSNFFFCFSFKNNRLKNAVLYSIFENAIKNTDQKNICVSIVAKAESKTKKALFRGLK